MDISKLTHGIKVVLGATIAFLIVSIFNWQEIDFRNRFRRSQHVAWLGCSRWPARDRDHRVGGIRLANVKVEIG